MCAEGWVCMRVETRGGSRHPLAAHHSSLLLPVCAVSAGMPGRFDALALAGASHMHRASSACQLNNTAVHHPVPPADRAPQGRFAVTAGTIVGLARLPALRSLETAYTVAPSEAPAALDEFAALTGARPAAGLCRLWLPAREGCS